MTAAVAEVGQPAVIAVDKRHSMKMMSPRVAAFLLTAISACPAAATETRFDHNGSQMVYVAIGGRAVIRYQTPRAGLARHGIVPGTILFEGSASRDGRLRGAAYTFARGCARAPYGVEGSLGRTLVLTGAAPLRALNCAVMGYRTDLDAARLVFQAQPVAEPQQPAVVQVAPPRPADPAAIVVHATEEVGDPGTRSTPDEQALNEALPRHLYVKRLPNDSRAYRIAWHVRPSTDMYAAMPDLFGSDNYPSGIVTMAPGQKTADIVVRTVPTGRPDWTRGFEVVLTDATSGKPVLSSIGLRPIVAGFSVAGDLKCKVGRADRCDPSKTIPLDEPSATEPAMPPVADLLATMCSAKDINGSDCENAKGYSHGQTCNVGFTGRSYRGRFVDASRVFVLADYDSECESHATEFGGSAVFEKVGDSFVFRAYQPSYRLNECVVAPGALRDRLICISSHNGYGQVTTMIAEYVLRASGKSISLSHDRLADASDNSGAYGLNRVYCGNQPASALERLGFSKLALGPTPGTVTAELTYADAALIRSVCKTAGQEFAGTVGPPPEDTAYIPENGEQHRQVLINLADRSMTTLREIPAVPLQSASTK